MARVESAQAIGSLSLPSRAPERSAFPLNSPPGPLPTGVTLVTALLGKVVKGRLQLGIDPLQELLAIERDGDVRHNTVVL